MGRLFLAAAGALLGVFLAACGGDEALARSILENDNREGVEACKRVGRLSPARAERFLPLIERLDARRANALTLSMGRAKVENSRGLLLDKIERADDDFESLCALWALENLKNSGDAKTMNALWKAALGERPRSANYAFELLQIQSGPDVSRFLSEKMRAAPEDARLAIRICALRAEAQLLPEIAEAASTEELKILALESMSPAIRAGQAAEYLGLAAGLESLPGRVQQAVLSAVLRLNARGELKAFAARAGRLGAELLEKLPPGRPLCVLGEAFLADEKARFNEEAMKLAARLGFAGISSPEGFFDESGGINADIDASMAERNLLYSKMRLARLRVTAVEKAFNFDKDGAAAEGESVDGFLQECRPMGAALWLKLFKKDTGAPFDAESLRAAALKCSHSGVKMLLRPADGSRLQSAAEALALIEKCALENICAVYDLQMEYIFASRAGKTLSAADAAEFVIRNKNRIGALVVCGLDENGGPCPIDKGVFDVRGFLDAVYDGGFGADTYLRGARGLHQNELPLQSMRESAEAWRKWF